MRAKVSFDGIARPYRWLEYLTFGNRLEVCRFYYLGQLDYARKALILGDGDGRFTSRLLTRNKQVTVDAVDSSGKMLDLLMARVKRQNPADLERLRVQHIDAQFFNPAEDGYDLVATLFFLDCLPESESTTVIERVKSVLNLSGYWVVSEFSIPERWPASMLARFIVWSLYRAFGMLTGLPLRSLPDYAALLAENGLRLKDRKIHLGGLLKSEVWVRATNLVDQTGKAIGPEATAFRLPDSHPER